MPSALELLKKVKKRLEVMNNLLELSRQERFCDFEKELQW